MKKSTIDFPKFLAERWGDPDKLLAFLHAYGHSDVQRPTVNQWFRRGSIPADRFGTLLGLIKLETGKDVPMENYLK